jgi:hypothetical protein
MTGRKLTRRDFLKFLGWALLDGAVLTSMGWIYSARIEPGWVEVNPVPIRLPRLPRSFDGLRLAHFSDIHIGGWMTRERLETIIDILLAEAPDVIVNTGDFVTGHGFDSNVRLELDTLQSALRRLTKKIPTFASQGNHDHWVDTLAVRQMLAGAGVVELNNRLHTFGQGADSLHLCGVDDIWEQKNRLDLVLDQIPESGAAILLAHEPDYADTTSQTGRFDLQLSGHTHGGQVVVPFFGPPVLPRMGRKYHTGLYQIGTMLQYTTRGVGMIPPAVRFNCRPEITLFTLEAGA